MNDTNQNPMGATAGTRGRSLLRPLLALALLVGVGASAGDARAESKVVTISEVTIVGRIQKPIASVDVARIQPKMTLADLHQPFLERITEAVYRAPF